MQPAIFHDHGFHLVDGVDVGEGFDLLLFGEGLPDGVDAFGLFVVGEVGEAIGEAFDGVVFLEGHGGEFADGLFERVDADVVWGGGIALDPFGLFENDGSTDEVAEALRARVGEKHHEADEIHAGEQVGGAEEIAEDDASPGGGGAIGVHHAEF